MKTKAITRLTFLAAIIAWIVLIFSDVAILLSDLNKLQPDIPKWLPQIMLDIYVIGLYYYYKFKIDRDETLNFTDLLWKVFASGLITTVFSLSIRFLMFLLGSTKLTSNVLFSDIIYQINFALLLNFLVATYTSWKRLIQYQKSKWLLRAWALFETILLFLLLYETLGGVFNSNVIIVAILTIGLLVVVLSANMKWVAYLNFKQKLTSLLLLALTLFYLGYFFYTLSNLSELIGARSEAFLNFREFIFNASLLGFVMVYSIFSFLVILFNLPTSSVFEQKLEEVVNFQRISQSTQTEQNEESVYKILLESSVNSVFADAAWLEIKDSNSDERIFTSHMTEAEARNIRDHITKNNIKGVLDQGPDKTKNLSRHLSSLKGARFRSLVAFPIVVKDQNIGTLALLKELPEGFNKEMTRIVSTFTNQAGISIENFRLMEEAFQHERYKEELKIAKKVQKSLLPEKLEKDNDFEMVAFSQSADEVGGDYYDTIRINDHLVALIVADVSGKGTTAAFHMSQMKGIFHSLAQQNLDPKEFMIRANQALTFCLERGSFISATYFVLNTQAKTIRYARAGHCPVLYYHASTNSSEYIKDKGTALGMVRSKEYCNFIESYEFPYNHGDIMVLYTDGITEAKNNKGEEFGNDRLQKTLDEVTAKSPREIQEHLIEQLYEYSGSDQINDDYTTMIVRFT